MRFGNCTRFHRSGTRNIRGHQIPLNVEVLRLLEFIQMQLIFRKIRRDAEKSIHGALSIGRDHHQAFARHTLTVAAHLIQPCDHARRV